MALGRSKIILGTQDFNTGVREEIKQNGLIVEGECFTGYDEETQTNTYVIHNDKEIAIGIDGNRNDEKTQWKYFEKGNGFDLEPYYSDDFIIANFF